MASSNVYKQSVFDHRSILLTVSVIDDGSLNVKNYHKLINNICQQFEIIKVQVPINNEGESPQKKIYFNFKRSYTVSEKNWENFQLHHRAVGLMFIGEFKYGMELDKILKSYVAEKDKGSGSVIESRLVLIYDENNEDMVRNIKQTLSWDEEIFSSSDTGEGNNAQCTFQDIDCEMEISYIKDSLLQNDIIWYKKSLIGGQNAGSSNSLTDSVSSGCSSAWKISSHNSDNSLSSPLKSPSLLSSSISDSYVTNELTSTETRQIYSFLKTIYDKLFTGLLSREAALLNKTEQTLNKNSNMESSSDSGSVLSLDDVDFNLTDPLDVDRKRLQDEHRFNKNNKIRHYLGRLSKQTGDYAMLCGNYWQAYHYYQLSICYLRRYNNDQLWLAGAEEGLCCSWIAFNFDTNHRTFDSQLVECLHAKCRQAFANQLKFSLNQPSPTDIIMPQNSSPNTDQIDLSFLKKFSTDQFRNPPEIPSLDDLNERYLGCISRYKKALKSKAESLHPINMDSCIKASRFFIDRHRYMDASNFLKLIKLDLMTTNIDNERYHNTLAKFYSQMGFKRKSMVHKYQTMLILQEKLDIVTGGASLMSKQKLTVNSSLPKQKITERKLSLIVDILSGLNVEVGHLLSNVDNVDDRSVQIIDNGRDNEFESLKMKIVSELFVTCKNHNYSTNTLIGLGLSILDNWHNLMTKVDCQKLVDDVNTFCRSESYKGQRLSRICFVKHLPRFRKITPTKLPDYLLPKRKERSTDAKSIFIYTPLSVNGRGNRKNPLPPVVWVCGEESELVLQFDNLLPITLHLSSVQILLHSDTCDVWVNTEGSSVHQLPPNSRDIHCHFIIIPSRDLIQIGEYQITNISYQILSIYNVVFYPHSSIIDHILQPTNTPAINIYPMLPQMKIFTSLPESAPLVTRYNPPNTVVASSLIIYDNEVFKFTLSLSNESKDINIDRVTCVLDELEMSSVSAMLISRVADDEFNNRQRSSFRMLSLVQEDIMDGLSIKCISSLKNVLTADTSSRCLPTDVPIKFVIDVTDRQFLAELFEKISESTSDSVNTVNPLWRGQFRVTFRYESDTECRARNNSGSSNSDLEAVVVEIANDGSSDDLYRELVCVVNCRVMLGLCVIGYRLESNLDLVLNLMNFTENKMNVDVYWKESKIKQGHIVIVPNCGHVTQYTDHAPTLQRLSSTECSSHILNYSIDADKLNLKSLIDNGSELAAEDLTIYIQSNLRIFWTMKDKSIGKMRQGNVNLNWCICGFAEEDSDSDSLNKESIAHELAFSISDVIKILISNNVELDVCAFTHEDHIDSPVPPRSPSDSPLSIKVFECVLYQIGCHFVQENWADSIRDDVLTRIMLRCSVTAMRISHISDSSSEEDNFKFQQFEIGGNSSMRFNRKTIKNGGELNGMVIFMVPGIYSVHCQLLIVPDETAVSHCTVNLLAESSKYEVHVT